VRFCFHAITGKIQWVEKRGAARRSGRSPAPRE
jgi:hypothetical protein